MAHKDKNPFRIVASVLNVPVEYITNDSGYGLTGGWDSKNHLSIFIEFETEYNISIPDEEIEKNTTMEKIVNFLKDEMNVEW